MSLKNLLSLPEAIVIALINHPHRILTLEKITKYIEDKELYVVSKDDRSLLEQVKLLTSNSCGEIHHWFEQPNENQIMLKNSDFGRYVMLTKGLEKILNHCYYHFNPVDIELKVFDVLLNESRVHKFSLEKIICIVTIEMPGKSGLVRSGRKKIIFYDDTGLDGKPELGEYHIDKSMVDLKNDLDIYGLYLALISDRVMVNVGYYTLSGSKNLDCICPFPELKNLNIRFSDSPRAKQNMEWFKITQSNYKGRISLQKMISDYKNEQFPKV